MKIRGVRFRSINLIGVAVASLLCACTVETEGPDAGDDGGSDVIEDDTGEDTMQEDSSMDTTPKDGSPGDGDVAEDTQSDTAPVDGGGTDVSQTMQLVRTNGEPKSDPDVCGSVEGTIAAGQTEAKDIPNGWVGNIGQPETYPFRLTKIQYYNAAASANPRCIVGLEHDIQIYVLGPNQNAPPSEPSKDARIKRTLTLPAQPWTQSNNKNIRTLAPADFGNITLREGEKLFVAIRLKKQSSASGGDAGMDGGTMDAADGGGGSSPYKYLCPGSCVGAPWGANSPPAPAKEGMTFITSNTTEPFQWSDLVKDLDQVGNLSILFWGQAPAP